MKKLFIPAIAALCMFAASCGNKTQPNVNPADTLTAVPAVEDASDVESLTSTLDAQLAASDKDGLQATIAAIRETYESYVKNGDMQNATTYATTIKEYLESHADQIKKIAEGDATITDIVSTVTNIPTDAETTVEQAKEYIKSLPTVEEAANAAADKAKEAATEKVNDVKNAAAEKANEKVNEAKEKTSKAVEDTKEKTNKAINDASKKASDAVNNAASKLLGK